MTPEKTRADRLVKTLLEADTLKGAAEAAGIPYRTARRMMQDPDVQQALADVRQEAARESVLEAAALARLARETLRQVMDDLTAPPHARVRAAEAALAYEKAVAELFDIHHRLEAIEARLSEQASKE